ncbi:hypothetical protein GQ44DRAFT_722500 [Phaeosphaeriaceae sp. PMI808]|nr:hypothetical protein GQ44DRAFT_722500 [Phaeosphaeriaceae sp. PMI808]
MRLAVLLLLLTAVLTVSQQNVFRGAVFPVCVSQCHDFLHSSARCIDDEQPLKCFCTLVGLRHRVCSGELCRESCDQGSVNRVSHVYSDFCGSAATCPTSTTIKGAPTVQTTAPSSSPKSQNTKKGVSKIWIVIAVILTIVCLIITIGYVTVHRKRKNEKAEWRNGGGQGIPLTAIPSSGRPTTGSQPSLPSESVSNLPVVPSSPLASPASAHDLESRLKEYKKEQERQERVQELQREWLRQHAEQTQDEAVPPTPARGYKYSLYPAPSEREKKRERE